MSRVVDWTVTLPVWAISVLAFLAMVVMVLVIAVAMSSAQADRIAEYNRQSILREDAERRHADRNQH